MHWALIWLLAAIVIHIINDNKNLNYLFEKR